MTPLKFLAATLAVILVLLAAAAGAFAAYGPDRFWSDTLGSLDTGPFDFDLPNRTGKMNDALACPPGDCAGTSLSTPAFPVPPETLLATVRALLEAQPGTEIVADDPEAMTLRAVVRTPLLRFPDTVSIRVRRSPDGVSGLWLYSRSRIGYSDLGTNAARLEALIAALTERLPNRPSISGASGRSVTPGS